MALWSCSKHKVSATFYHSSLTKVKKRDNFVMSESTKNKPQKLLSTYFSYGMYIQNFRILKKCYQDTASLVNYVWISQKGALPTTLGIFDAARQKVNQNFYIQQGYCILNINFICPTVLKTSCPQEVKKESIHTIYRILFYLFTCI